jgi:uncharacterized membrane protein
MIDLILAIKFVHVLGAGAMFGAWLAIAAFMLLARRSGNPSVIALVAQFVVRVELFVVAPAMALGPISGFPLAAVIGLSPADDFWIAFSLVLYAIVALVWVVAIRIEMRLRKLARQAALGGPPLAQAYRRLFRIWSALAVVIVAGMILLFLVMIWQPRLD